MWEPKGENSRFWFRYPGARYETDFYFLHFSSETLLKQQKINQNQNLKVNPEKITTLLGFPHVWKETKRRRPQGALTGVVTDIGEVGRPLVTSQRTKLNLLTGWRWSLSLENIVKVTLSRIWGIIFTQTSLVTIVSKSTVLHPHKCCIATPSSMEMNMDLITKLNRSSAHSSPASASSGLLSGHHH